MTRQQVGWYDGSRVHQMNVRPVGEVPRHLAHTAGWVAVFVGEDDMPAASTGRVSEFEATMRLRWLKDLVQRQQDRNSGEGRIDPETGSWEGPEWVTMANEELDALYEAAEKSKGVRFADTWCSQCGTKFGPGDCGFSSCADHAIPATDAPDDLAALVRRLVRALRKAAPDHALADDAADYLQRMGFDKSPLRAAAPLPPSLQAQAQAVGAGGDADSLEPSEPAL